MAKDHESSVRPVTQDLVSAVVMDIWPRPATIVDFGITSQKHYEALYYPIRAGEITPRQLDAALGHGPKLTELVNAARSNPHKGIRFETDWDALYGRTTAKEPEFHRVCGFETPSKKFSATISLEKGQSVGPHDDALEVSHRGKLIARLSIFTADNLSSLAQKRPEQVLDDLRERLPGEEFTRADVSELGGLARKASSALEALSKGKSLEQWQRETATQDGGREKEGHPVFRAEPLKLEPERDTPEERERKRGR